jgi:hypothetical protein
MSRSIICNVLICGYHDLCGQREVYRIINQFIRHDLLRYYKIENVNIVSSSNFFDIYPIIDTFDYIILCRRNIYSITFRKNEYSKFIEQFNCWSLFASIIIPYEQSSNYKKRQIHKLFNDLVVVQEEAPPSKNKLLESFLISNNYC